MEGGYMRRQIIGSVCVAAAVTMMSGSIYAYTAGTYTGSGTGHNGPVSVEVTVSEDAIENIEITETSESVYMGEVASEHVISDVLEYQSLAVDSVSGCTISRQAFLAAITDALTQAGGDIDALKKVEIPQKTGEERTIDTDVVVIGSGGAGLTAALQAAYDGADVVVLEKLARLGGSTLTSSAMLVVAGSKLQEEAGIEDNVQNLKDYFNERSEGIADPEWTDFYAENINDILNWFMDLGVNYTKDLVLIQGTTTTPRAHMPVESGRELIPRLVEEAEKNGVQILTETPAVSLIQDENGRYIGVHATTKGGDDITVKGKGVLVATGSYSANPEMLARLNPKMDNIEILVGSGDGSGYNMLEKAGADMIQIDYIAMMYYFYGQGWTEFPELIPESPTIPNCEVLSVDGAGKRIVSEDDFTFEYTKINYEEGYHEGYCVYGQATADKYPIMTRLGLTTKTHNGDDFGYKEDTIEALAAHVGFDPEVLKATVERYNELCDKGVDEDFGKDPQYLVKIEAPYYLLRMPMICTDGYNGARINEFAQVIDTNGQPIPGLYAAGAVASAQVTNINYFGCGTMLLNCGVYGREAADHVVSMLLNK